MTVGMNVTLRDGEEFVLDMLQPRTKWLRGKVLVADAKGERWRYFAGVVGGTFKYLPPETTLTAPGLLWASKDWEPVRPFDVPAPQKIVLPPQPNWTEYFLGHPL